MLRNIIGLVTVTVTLSAGVIAWPAIAEEPSCPGSAVERTSHRILVPQGAACPPSATALDQATVLRRGAC